MADLLVRNLEDVIVRRLREEAAREGVSAEEAHRRLLRRTLLSDSDGRRMNLKEYLLSMPDFGDDEDFLPERRSDEIRPVDL
jgi:plasmid stability protein